VSTQRWTKGVFMPARLILGPNELQHAINDLETAVGLQLAKVSDVDDTDLRIRNLIGTTRGPR